MPPGRVCQATGRSRYISYELAHYNPLQMRSLNFHFFPNKIMCPPRSAVASAVQEQLDICPRLAWTVTRLEPRF